MHNPYPMLMVDIMRTDTYRQLLAEELKLLEIDPSTGDYVEGSEKRARRRAKRKSRKILEAKRIEENEKERIRRIERNKRRNKVNNNKKFGTKIISSTSNIQTTNIPQDQRDAFYQTQEWKDARDEWKEGKDKVCSRCGRRPDPNYKKAPIDRNRSQEEKEFLYNEFNDNRLLVDHILPIKTYWGLRLEKHNFQYLCGTCNKEKCNTISYKDVKRVLGKVKPIEILKVESNV